MSEIVVTLAEGGKRRRYVVTPEDRHLFDGLTDTDLPLPWSFYFGAQWLRGPGRIDEMYRSLSGESIVKIARKATV